jgi:putative PIN family toxin of toxin-antitoxin system
VRIVLGTNVLVSGLLCASGPPGAVLDAVTHLRIRLLVDPRILAEYRQVLVRRDLGIPEDVRETILDRLALLAEHVLPGRLSVADELPDEGDRPFVECALAGLADCIVTGNKRHFPARACGGVRVASPAEFLTLLTEPRRG